MAQSKSRMPSQPDGMSQGRHLTGFKGSKVEDPCYCGRCNPKAKANHGRAKIMINGKIRNEKISRSVG